MHFCDSVRNHCMNFWHIRKLGSKKKDFIETSFIENPGSLCDQLNFLMRKQRKPLASNFPPLAAGYPDATTGFSEFLQLQT